MLEYMLVRTADAPIIAQSRGKLQWVVLDEAHTYVGSQAAEAALLIRRVLLAFGVKPEQVRFIATSATIGDPEGEAGKKLKRFLADVAGVSQGNVYLVSGEREIPRLIEEKSVTDYSLSKLTENENDLDTPGRLFEALTQNFTARRIRELFIGNPHLPPVATLSEISKVIFKQDKDFTLKQFKEALGWLDLLSQANAKPENENGDSQNFLPLRAHIFHRTLSGIWACADSNCPLRKETTLNDRAWGFGQIYFEPRKHCDCQSPVYEVVKCGGCGTVHLKAGIDISGKVTHFKQLNILDEFELDTEEYDQLEEETEDNTESDSNSQQYQLLIVDQNINRASSLNIERNTRQVVESSENSIRVQALEDVGNGLICPGCEEKERSGRQLFKTSRIGAPYFLGGILPTLLEYAPDGENIADSPYRGRRLLSFNDSRQGTARMATKLQQESERNRIRNLIYHLTLSEGIGNSSDKIKEKLTEIDQYKDALNQELPESARSILETSLTKLQDEIQEFSKPATISFNDLAHKLTIQGKDFDLMLNQYQQYAPKVYGGESGRTDLAKTFLIREFGRRPKYSNSLETMGMIAIQYPKLAKISKVPTIVVQATDFNLDDWRDFLKICLDYIRSIGSLAIPDDWRKWLGIPFPQTYLVNRDEENCGRKQRRWLRAKRSGKLSNLIRLLSFVLKTDIATTEGEDRIDVVLDAAWRELIQIGLLQQTTDGRVLNLDKLAFTPMESAWICPVTRRFLDTTLRGATYYLPRIPSKETAICELVRIPIYDEPFAGETDDLERIKLGRDWLNERSDIAELRNKGLWSAQNDRVIELSPYFTTAEHSAQQDSKTLQRYEKNFKEGTLNLLSCTTTMEMGIDIGGISIVAMNNVPPHPANYLQRAGRAGRRQESRSLAVTLCKSNPHDQNVFSNTRWAFDSVLPAPGVSLDSAIIIQRHINSFLLSKFFNKEFSTAKVESTKLTCGTFFMDEVPMSSSFSAWCRSFDNDISNDDLKNGLEQLVRHSILEGRNFSQLLESAATLLEEISNKWLKELQLLEDEEKEIIKAGGGKESPAFGAVSIHKQRLTDEYLLRELATRGFLPAYGFPTNIASFDNLTVDRFIRNLESREDNRYRRRELASRDLTTALREYAPGSEVVMDGLVYVSAGVTLNWHIPADQGDIKEIQNIKFAWRCRRCGSSGSDHSLNAARSCRYCGAEVSSGEIQEFLEPSGFAVDFYKTPSNDVSSQKFIPVEDPWINARGDWFPLTNPGLGRFRSTTRGHVFNQSRGISGTGYALCLECGRAEPMLSDGELPKIFETPHKKLRRNKEDSDFCQGSYNSWKIKQEITLGHETWTDISELQLKNTEGIWLNDKTIALTLAVVLRDALAELLGVQATELGCGIKPARTETGNSCYSIIIFDRFAAGYSSSVNRFLPEIFHRASNRLDCLANCDSICPHCVLDYDQRFSADSLDRREAASFLNTEWLDSFRLPENLAFFGKISSLENKSLKESIWREVSKDNIRILRFYTSGNVDNWDVAVSPLRSIIYKLVGKNIEIELMLEDNSIQSLSPNDRFLLAGLSDIPGVTLRELNFSPRLNQGWVVAETIGNSSIRWAVSDEKTLRFDSEWGKTNELIRGENTEVFSVSDKIYFGTDIRPDLSKFGDLSIEITTELDGNIKGLGKRIWEHFKICHLPVKEVFENEDNVLTSITYSDRYLFSPLTITLFYNLVEYLITEFGDKRSSPLLVKLITETVRNNNHYRKTSNYVWNNWINSKHRDQTTKQMFSSFSIDVDFSLDSRRKSEIEHSRKMILEFSLGKTLTILFDEGVGYWQRVGAADRQRAKFDFSADVEAQSDRLLSLDLNIEGRELPTHVLLKVRD